jgi:hypothetical protein
MAIALLLTAPLSAADGPAPVPTAKPSADRPSSEKAHNVLTDAEKAEGWKLLFNGKDLTGWVNNPAFQAKPVKWEADAPAGVIRGSGNAGYLCTTEIFADFEFACEARIWDTRADGKGHGNSGVKFRCTAPKPYPAEFYPLAYEMQIDHVDKKNGTGCIYDLLPAKPTGTKDGEWVSLRLRAVGNRFTIWVNGEQVCDGTDPDNRHMSGFLGLQMHHPTNVVEFRDVKVRPLSAGSAGSAGSAK